jgi:hypothetical protein
VATGADTVSKAVASVRTTLGAVTAADARRWWERTTLALSAAARTLESSAVAFANDLSAGLAAADDDDSGPPPAPAATTTTTAATDAPPPASFQL